MLPVPSRVPALPLPAEERTASNSETTPPHPAPGQPESEEKQNQKTNHNKHSRLKNATALVAVLMALFGGSPAARAAEVPLLDLTGRGSDGTYDITMSAQLTTTGATGYARLLGRPNNPVIQVVPPSTETSNCWCITVQRADTRPSDGDQRQHFYVRDVGDGTNTFDQFAIRTSLGRDCNTLPYSDLYWFTVKQGDFVGFIADSDEDGVLDSVDQCPGTEAGTAVNAQGCSIAQLVPCAGPVSGGTWKSHGKYVSAVKKAAKAFYKAGLITQGERKAIGKAASRSDCGKKKHNKK